jgi:hypothetical protein
MTTTVEKIAAETAATARSLRVCLAASGGGHLRQLLDLQPVWEKHRYFFVTEDTALGRTLGDKHPTRFLPHFAWGQAKQGAVLRMLGRAAISFFRSGAIMLRERPDVLITTGAGAVYFPVLWARVWDQGHRNRILRPVRKAVAVRAPHRPSRQPLHYPVPQGRALVSEG